MRSFTTRLWSAASRKVRLREKVRDYFFEKDGVANPPDIIRLFNLCENMRWSTLPVSGGLYDQSPDFIDGIELCFMMKGKKQRIDYEKAEAERKTRERMASSRSKHR